jgi:hypothetical protein
MTILEKIAREENEATTANESYRVTRIGRCIDSLRNSPGHRSIQTTLRYYTPCLSAKQWQASTNAEHKVLRELMTSIDAQVRRDYFDCRVSEENGGLSTYDGHPTTENCAGSLPTLGRLHNDLDRISALQTHLAALDAQLRE